MKRPANPLDIIARALALAAAVGVTSLIVGVHAADLSTLGGHEVVTAAAWPDASGAQVASVHERRLPHRTARSGLATAADTLRRRA